MILLVFIQADDGAAVDRMWSRCLSPDVYFRGSMARPHNLLVFIFLSMSLSSFSPPSCDAMSRVRAFSLLPPSRQVWCFLCVYALFLLFWATAYSWRQLNDYRRRALASWWQAMNHGQKFHLGACAAKFAKLLVVCICPPLVGGVF